MPRSSYACPASGLYVSTCECQARRVVSLGERFPRCPRCDYRVNWVLMRRFAPPPPRRDWTLN